MRRGGYESNCENRVFYGGSKRGLDGRVKGERARRFMFLLKVPNSERGSSIIFEGSACLGLANGPPRTRKSFPS